MPSEFVQSPVGSIPSDWKAVRLGEHAEIRARIGWRGLSSSEYTEDGPYLIAGKHLDNGTIRWDGCDHLSVERYEESHEIALREQDVVLSKDGTIGRVGFIETLPGPATINGTMMLVRPKTHWGRFLFYYLQGAQFQRLILEKVSGSSVPHIFQRDMVRLWAPLPPLPEQKRIAVILSSVDEAIQATQAVLEQTRRVKEGLLQDLLTRGIGHTRLKQTEIGNIPDSWEVRRLRELSNVVRGSTPRPARDPRYFDGDHTPWITVGLLSQTDSPYLDSTPTCLTEDGSKRSRHLSAGTVVISNSGFGCGVPKVLRISGCANDGIAAFQKLSKSVDPLFLYYYLLSRTQWLRNVVARGVDQPNLNTSLLGDVSVPLPPLPEQKEICKTLGAHDEALGLHNRALGGLERVKAGLLQDLLTGKVRVSV